jgi:hypothetical protein
MGADALRQWTGQLRAALLSAAPQWGRMTSRRSGSLPTLSATTR